ncbi:MAG: hypothetical protein ACT4OM_13390 [Actinomycetota bacterium]
MPEEWGGNPLAEGSQEAAQKTAAITMLVAQGIKHMQRVKEEQTNLADARSSQERERLRAQLRSEHDSARQQWQKVSPNADDPTTPLFHNAPDHVNQMRIRGGQEFALWSSAQPFVATDRDAQRIAETCSRRLETFQPKLIEDYARLRDSGLDPVDALCAAGQNQHNWQVVSETVPVGPDFSSAARAADTIAGDERQEAMTTGGRADDPTTPNVDERSEGLARSGDMREHSVVQGSMANTLSNQAQPYSMQTRLVANAGTTTRVAFNQPRPGRAREPEPAGRRR